MTNKRIPDLTAATTPLAGTELVLVWDGMTTKQVSVTNLTTGRVVAGTQFTASTGNFIPATSGKGVDFSVVTPAAGMTSKVLSNYEEGTWTPDFSSWTVAPSYTAATYTRVGRVVHVFIQAAYGTIPIAAYIGGLPFVVGPAGGSFTGVDSANANITGFSYSGNSGFQNVTPMTLTGWWAMSGSYNI